LSHLLSCLVLKSEAPLQFSSLGSTQPGHGWPHRSQLQPAADSGPRSIALAAAAFSNISLACAVSLLKKRVVFNGFAPFCCYKRNGLIVGALRMHWLCFVNFALTSSRRWLPFGVLQTAHYDQRVERHDQIGRAH